MNIVNGLASFCKWVNWYYKDKKTHHQVKTLCRMMAKQTCYTGERIIAERDADGHLIKFIRF